MTALMSLTLALSAVNGLLALGLGAVYVRNHRQLRSPFTLGLALFALFLVVHSLTTLYHGVTMMTTFTVQAERFLLAECILELGALGALAYATLR